MGGTGTRTRTDTLVLLHPGMRRFTVARFAQNAFRMWPVGLPSWESSQHPLVGGCVGYGVFAPLCFLKCSLPSFLAKLVYSSGVRLGHFSKFKSNLKSNANQKCRPRIIQMLVVFINCSLQASCSLADTIVRGRNSHCNTAH